MSRRLFGSVAVAGAILVSWVAVSQPASRAVPAPAPLGPAQLLRNALRPGILPAPEGSPGPYLLQHGRARALFRETGVELRLPSQTRPMRELGWSVVGGRAVRPQAEKPRGTTFFQQGGREVPSYGGLRYPGVRPGVDLWFEERPEGVEYGFRAERGADLKRVALEYAGAREVRVVDEGRALEVDLEEGVLREDGLWCAQESAGGASREVGCRFTDVHRVGRERWAYAIEVDVEDPERPVVVDPVIRWSTYIGGSLDDEFGSMTVTDAGHILVVGTVDVDSSLLSCNCMDGLAIDGKAVLVARFQEDGGFAGRRILNGSGVDIGRAITLGKDGMVYIAGETTSAAFGSVPSNKGAGMKEGFVAQLDVSDPAVWKFRWIYLVGSPNGDETIHAISAGADGGLFVVGETTSLDFPGAPVGTTDGGKDAFVSRLNPATAPDGSIATTVEWSTVGRGAQDEVLYSVVVDEVGRVYVTGRSASPGLLPGSPRPHAGPAGTDDVFVARLNPADGGVDRSLYLGGQGNDEGRALALKGAGNTSLYVAGTTRSANFPLDAGAANSVSDAFVVTLDRESFGLKSVRVVGGPAVNDEGLALAVDRSAATDIVFLGGRTASPGDFPLVQPFDRFYGGLTEGFVARLEVDAGASLSWSSLVGGGGDDAVLALNSERPGRLLVGGNTNSDDLIPLGIPGYNTNPRGGRDLFLMQLDPDASTPDTGPGTDAGTDAGVDAGTDAGVDAGTDAGVDAGTDAGVDAGTDAGMDGGTRVPASPLGWSCGAGGTRGGPGLLSLGTLAGLALLARRRKRAALHG